MLNDTPHRLHTHMHSIIKLSLVVNETIYKYHKYGDKCLSLTFLPLNWHIEAERTNSTTALFVDNLILVVKKDEVVERNLRMLDEVMNKWSMQINWKKTKVLKVERGGCTRDKAVKGRRLTSEDNLKSLSG